jgi:hypothetical protein
VSEIQVRRVTDPSPDGAAYRFGVELAPAPPASAEDWARGALEGAPAAYRLVLQLGWRFGLVLHLARSGTPGQIAGWTTSDVGPDTVTLSASSPLVEAAHEVTFVDGIVRWTTVLRYRNRLGRLLWKAAAPVHELTMPWLLRRAARRIADRPAP